MTTAEKLYKDNKDIKCFATGYLEVLAKLLLSLDTQEIKVFADRLEKARIEQRTIFLIGNGGSAATASHMANDFGIGITKYTNIDRPFRFLALTDCVPVMSAIANDDCYEHVFLSQLKVHYRPGDVLVCISASGHSINVLNAAKWIKDKGGSVLALTGFDGGKLRNMADAAIHVPTPQGDFGHVEDVHMVMDHLLANWFAQYLKGT